MDKAYNMDQLLAEKWGKLDTVCYTLDTNMPLYQPTRHKLEPGDSICIIPWFTCAVNLDKINKSRFAECIHETEAQAGLTVRRKYLMYDSYEMNHWTQQTAIT